MTRRSPVFVPSPREWRAGDEGIVEKDSSQPELIDSRPIRHVRIGAFDKSHQWTALFAKGSAPLGHSEKRLWSIANWNDPFQVRIGTVDARTNRPIAGSRRKHVFRTNS